MSTYVWLCLRVLLLVLVMYGQEVSTRLISVRLELANVMIVLLQMEQAMHKFVFRHVLHGFVTVK